MKLIAKNTSIFIMSGSLESCYLIKLSQDVLAKPLYPCSSYPLPYSYAFS